MTKLLEKLNTLPKSKGRFTVRDYEIMPDNGKVLQLIEGDFYMSPAPSLKHQEVSRIIQYLELNAIFYYDWEQD
jgi:hypothetical protein